MYFAIAVVIWAIALGTALFFLIRLHNRKRWDADDRVLSIFGTAVATAMYGFGWPVTVPVTILGSAVYFILRKVVGA